MCSSDLAELKNNIKQYWWTAMVRMHENIVGIDASIFMHPTTWKASGHVDAFNDPLIDNKDSKKRYRADVLIEEHIAKIEAKIQKDVDKAAKRFGDAFDPNDVAELPWGSLELDLDCDGGTARYESSEPGFGQGQLTLVKLTELDGLACPD